MVVFLFSTHGGIFIFHSWWYFYFPLMVVFLFSTHGGIFIFHSWWYFYFPLMVVFLFSTHGGILLVLLCNASVRECSFGNYSVPNKKFIVLNLFINFVCRLNTSENNKSCSICCRWTVPSFMLHKHFDHSKCYLANMFI